MATILFFEKGKLENKNQISLTDLKNNPKSNFKSITRQKRVLNAIQEGLNVQGRILPIEEHLPC